MYVDGHTPVNCLMTARIRGVIEAGDLHLALNKVQRKHPLLRAHAVEEGGQINLSFSEDPPRIPVRIVERKSDEGWRDETIAEWKTPFDMKKGPMARLVWIKSEGVSELMLVGHHCICDGASLLTIFRELLKIMDRPDLELTPYPPFRSLRELLTQDVLSDRKMLMLMKAKAALFRLFALTVKSGHAAPPIDPYFIYWRASEEESAELAQRCKAEGVTPFAALCVAFLSAFRRVNAARFKNKIMCPVDIRRLVRTIRPDAMFNYAPPIPLSLDLRIDPQKGFWDLARRLKQSISQKVGRLNGYEHLMAAEELQTIIPKVISFLRKSKGSYDFAFSNIGRLDIPDKYRTFRLESFLGVNVAVPWRNATTIVTSHFRGNTDIAFVSNHTFLPHAEALAIQDAALSLLRNAISMRAAA